MTGIKALPEELNIKSLDFYIEALKKYPKLFVGFDMVSYEDTNSLEYYTNYITPYLNEHQDLNPVVLYHAGESFKRSNKSCETAINNKSVRLGHGLNLIRSPETIKLAVEKKILLEANPLSNLLLGYVGDLNWHPVKFLKEFGVEIRYIVFI